MNQAEHWDNRYRTGDNPWDTGRPSPELMRVVAEAKIMPCRAIELGCGTGINAIWLAQQGFDVTAIDISPTAIQIARDLASKVAVRFIVGDVLDPPANLGEPFPFFFDRGCYHAVRRVDVDRYLATLDRITAPDTVGLILAGNAREKHEPGPPVVSEEEIRNEIGRLFEIEHLREFRFDPKPGISENFLAWSCFVKKK